MRITEKDAVITHSVLGEFTSFEGGESSIPITTEVVDSKGSQEHFQGTPERTNITLGRHYDPVAETDFEKRHGNGDALAGEILVQFIDPDGIPIPGRSHTYVGARVTRLAPPPKNKNSNTPSRIQYECVWLKKI